MRVTATNGNNKLCPLRNSELRHDIYVSYGIANIKKASEIIDHNETDGSMYILTECIEDIKH